MLNLTMLWGGGDISLKNFHVILSATLHHVVQNQPTVNTQLPPFT